MLRTLILTLLVFLFSQGCLIHAEILQIVMKWDALLCLNVCEPTLRQQLNNISNLAAVTINSRAGTAIMQWKPNYPFSYAPFNLATRTVGIRIADFRLKIRGTISHREDNFYIVSEGDYSTFLLIGPIRAVPNRYIIQQNIASHPLTANMRAQLQNLAETRQIVEIEGPLFEPLRSWLIIVVEQLKLPKDEKPINTIREIEKYKIP